MDAAPRTSLLCVITQSEFGGAQRFLAEVVPHLSAQGFAVTVAAGSGSLSRRGGSADSILTALAAQGIATVPLQYLVRDASPLTDIRALNELITLIREERPDTLFLLSSKAGFLGSLAGRLARWFGGPKPRIVYRIGGWTFNDPWPAWKRYLYLCLEKWSARWKDAIITNARRDGDDAKRFGILPTSGIVHTVPNGIDADACGFLPRSAAQEALMRALPGAGALGTRPLIGCLANFYTTKGHRVLIDAFARVQKTHPDATLVLIGDGRERAAIAAQATHAGIASAVRFTGFVADARTFLRAFDAVVLPSLKEGFPWAVLEAMAAGVPVVATSVGAVPELITNGETGLMVKPGDADALAGALVNLIERPDRRAYLAEHALAMVHTRYRLESTVRDIATILRPPQ